MKTLLPEIQETRDVELLISVIPAGQSIKLMHHPLNPEIASKGICCVDFL
jgi:hypothetical protein